MVAALLTQGVLQHFVPIGADFPYAFFYLIAVFVTAWFGGYVPGALACLLVLVGLPFASTGFSKMPPIDREPHGAVRRRLAPDQSNGADTAPRKRSAERHQRRTRSPRSGYELRNSARSSSNYRRKSRATARPKPRYARARSALNLPWKPRASADWILISRPARPTAPFATIGYSGTTNCSPSGPREAARSRYSRRTGQHVAEKFEAAVRSGNVCEFECRIKHAGTRRPLDLRPRQNPP